MLQRSFFDAVRAALFGGSLSQSQVDSLETLHSTWLDTNIFSIDQEAYVFATVLNECGTALQPVSENLNYSADRAHQVWPNKFPTVAAAVPYEHNPERLANHVYAGIIGNGDEASGDGWRFRGRGFSQITGRANYAKFGQIIGRDLISSPDAVLDQKIGAEILIVGMQKGLFTGKKLSDYFSGSMADPLHARATVNGDVTSTGPRVERYWSVFRSALQAMPQDVTMPVQPPASLSPPSTPNVPPAIKPPAVLPPSDVMKAWQQRLIDVATSEGKLNPLPKYGADGFGGAETRNAILAFQASRNPPLPQTGQLDDTTRAALNPPLPRVSISPGVATAVAEIVTNLAIPPSPAKDIIMNFLPTIVQWIVSLLPGIPDDIAKVSAELRELASNDSGVAKLRSAVAFGRAFLNEADRILNEIDPSGTIQPSAPVPPAVAAQSQPAMPPPPTPAP